MKEDWIECVLGEVCSFVGGGTPSKSNSEYWNGNIPWASIKDIKGDFLEKTQDFITEIGLKESASNLALENDIILATRINPGKPIISKIKTAINQDLKVVRHKTEIDTKFLFYNFKNLEKTVVKLSSGTTVLGINLNSLNSIQIPLAPLPIQRAIVSKIEALFSDLDNGIANFKKAQAQLKIYRQAVLKKAFEGELTKEWREGFVKTDGRPSQPTSQLPTAEELLQQIKEERQNHYNQQIEDWKKAVKEWEKNGKVGKKPSKPTQPKELPALIEEEVNELPKLPKSMVWSQLGNVVWSVKDGPHFSPEYSKTGIPFISGGNIRPEKIDFEKVKYISEELHQELSRRCKPEIDDILYTKGGTTGIARVNTYKFDFNVWVHVAVLRPIQMIVPLYFNGS